MEKPKFILRKCVNLSVKGRKATQYVTFDIMRVIKDGEELICEFHPAHKKLAAKCVKALNKP